MGTISNIIALLAPAKRSQKHFWLDLFSIHFHLKYRNINELQSICACLLGLCTPKSDQINLKYFNTQVCLALLILISYKIKHWIIIQLTRASRKLEKNTSVFTMNEQKLVVACEIHSPILGLRRVLCVKKRKGNLKEAQVPTECQGCADLPLNSVGRTLIEGDRHETVTLCLGLPLALPAGWGKSEQHMGSELCVSDSQLLKFWWCHQVFQFCLIFSTKELWAFRAGGRGGKDPFLLSSLFFTSMLLGRKLQPVLGDLMQHSSSYWCHTATAVVSVPTHWNVIYTRSYFAVTVVLVYCYQQYGSARRSVVWEGPLPFFCTRLCDTKDEKQQHVSSATRYQNDWRLGEAKLWLHCLVPWECFDM